MAGKHCGTGKNLRVWRSAGSMKRRTIDRVAGKLFAAFGVATVCSLLSHTGALAQSIRVPWSDYAHDAQHSGISPAASQPLNHILWQTSVDLSVPTNNTSELFIHYGSPLITRSNTVIVPVKTTGDRRVPHRGARGHQWRVEVDAIHGLHPAASRLDAEFFANADSEEPTLFSRWWRHRLLL